VLGRAVALVDADIGLRNLDVTLGLENRIVYDLVDVVDGYCDVRQALIRDKRFDGLCLLPAAQTRDKTSVSPDQMRRLATELAAEFDYVLIDSPAGIEQGFRNAVSGADHAVIVTTPELAAVRDADRVIGLLEAMGFLDPRLIINRVRMRLMRRGDLMEVADMLDLLATDLLGIVPEEERVIAGNNRGEPVTGWRGSLAGRAFYNIARRLEGDEVPLLDLEGGTGFLGRLRRLLGSGA